MPALGLGIGIRIGLLASGAAAAAPISAVDALGWKATMPTPVDLALSPITVSRQGYDSTGATTTYSETLFTTKRVRLPFPNQATLTTDTVALSDYVYSTDTISGVTNSSAETSPQPVANWAIPDRSIVGNSLPVEIVAFHRNGIACVEITATDGTNTVTSKVSSVTVSALSGDVHPVLVYAATLDITSLTDNTNITVNAKVYPRIGAAASVLDSSASSDIREFSPRVWRKNTSRNSAPPIVYISSTGNDTTGVVDTNDATASASPCLTLTGAINRARTVLGTGTGSLDGLRVRFTAGTWSLSASPTANTVNAAVVFEPGTGVAKADVTWSVGAANIHTALTYTHWRNLKIFRAGVNTLFATTGGHFTLDNVDLDNNSQSAPLGSTTNTGVYLIGGVAITNWGGSQTLFNGAALQVRMLRGVTGGTAGAGTSTEMWLVLGSLLRGVRNVLLTRNYSGSIIAFNRFMSVGSASGAVYQLDSSTEDTVGLAIVQNVFEYISASAQPNYRVSGDSAGNNTTHVICWHNTFAGFDTYGRGNILYNDNAVDARTHKLASFIGNIHVQINTKHDVFALNGALVGGWSYLYGVGQRGEFSRYRDAGSGAWAQEYAGPSSSIGTVNTGAGNDPLFTSYAGTTSVPGAGAGNGTYTLQGGSPARSRVTDSPLPFDLAGSARSGTVAAGAYV